MLTNIINNRIMRIGILFFFFSMIVYFILVGLIDKYCFKCLLDDIFLRLFMFLVDKHCQVILTVYFSIYSLFPCRLG